MKLNESNVARKEARKQIVAKHRASDKGKATYAKYRSSMKCAITSMLLSANEELD